MSTSSSSINLAPEGKNYPLAPRHHNSVAENQSVGTREKIKTAVITAFAIAALIGIGFLTAGTLPTGLAIGATWLSYGIIGKLAIKKISFLWKEVATIAEKIYKISILISAPFVLGASILGLGLSTAVAFSSVGSTIFGETVFALSTKQENDGFDSLESPPEYVPYPIK